MTKPDRPPRLTADAFIAWADEQPRGRYELVRGEIIAMAPEQAGHVRAKFAAAKAIEAGLLRGDHPCEALIDGVGVQIDDHTLYIPDVFVRCGPPIPDDAMAVSDPLIVVEVLSPSTRAIDSGAKLMDYFRLPSLRHYLVVDGDARAVTHHRRDEAGGIATRILRDGALVLDPPGLELAVAAFFAALRTRAGP